VHEGCDRAGYYEQGDFAHEYGSPKCLVKIGCWGPVVKCNVPKRGWMAGIGGCPNVGGICIGCTMPGFPDKFMPFMDEPPGSKVSTTASGVYGGVVRALRTITSRSLEREPKWRRKGSQLRTGYDVPFTPGKYRMHDDSVTVAANGHPEYVGKSITRHGEDIRKDDSEPGRYRTAPARRGERPGGKSTARDATGVDPQDPIDKRMPNLIP
jgi:NiFe/NiFeSe hydrogenase small subunit C-terminal